MGKPLTKYCLFCGREAKTKDHVPSQNLFEEPFPDNLLTVDCCSGCNGDYSLDEEYFLNVLIQISDNPNLQKRVTEGGSVFRSWQRSPKLKQRILNSLVQGDDGRTYFNPEYSRIQRVVEKNALGLYYHRYGRRANLDRFECIGVYPFTVQETRPAEIYLLTHTEKFLPKKWTNIQDNVFSYIVVRDWRRNNQLTMIFHIHNAVWCVIAIPSPRSQKRSGKSEKNQAKLF